MAELTESNTTNITLAKASKRSQAQPPQQSFTSPGAGRFVLSGGSGSISIGAINSAQRFPATIRGSPSALFNSEKSLLKWKVHTKHHRPPQQRVRENELFIIVHSYICIYFCGCLRSRRRNNNIVIDGCCDVIGALIKLCVAVKIKEEKTVLKIT